ncbi:MAG: YcjX family protein [Motiliproteus sp.]
MGKDVGANNPLTSLKRSLERGSDSTRDALHKLSSERKFIGITGLSRSGKSTFITSLINQLLNHDNAKLGAFSPWLSKRIVAVKVHPLADRSLKQFPYPDAIRDLADSPPRWPGSTTDISGCLLEIKIGRNASWSRKSATRSVFLEIRDYPGEWLLDLPLMQMSFAEWCSQCAAQFTQQPRLSLAGDLTAELQQIDPLAQYDAQAIDALHSQYANFLKRCKNEQHALSLIQPGRFLIPGEFIGQEVLHFVPLLSCNSCTRTQLESANPDSNFKVLERRYDAYVKQVVAPFYKKFFRPIDRQVVLVDVINALNGGPEYIADMQQALSNISDSFSYGSNSPILKLFRPKIEKVIFAASKIDQVVAKDHDNVRQLLASIVRKALENAAYKGVEHRSEAISAIRSSHEILHRGAFAVTGIGVGGESVGYVHPEIPDHVPKGDEWLPFRDWSLPLLNPPAGVRCDQEQAIPHIRMDQILQDLIGDLCR